MHWPKCLLQHDFNFILFGYDSHFIIWSNSLLLLLLAFLRWSFLCCISIWHCQIFGLYEVTMTIHLFESFEIFWSLVSLWKKVNIIKNSKGNQNWVIIKITSQYCFLLHCLPGKGLEKGNYFYVILCCFYTKVYFSKLHLRV